MFYHFTRKGLLATTLTFLLMALLGSVQAFAASTPAGSTQTFAPPTLGFAAAAHGITFGAAADANRLSTTQYTDLLSQQFTGITAENEMKWDAIEPTRGTFTFGPADALVSFAQSHHMRVRGHNLVWHNQLASWVSTITSGTDLLQAMRDHIAGEAGHFRGKVVSWDVVNEAFNEDGTRRASIFQQEIGGIYLEDAFRAAHAADPHALLCYNDFNIEGINAKSDAVFAMVKDFKARGVPIGCVGFQAHLIVGEVPSSFQANLQRFARLGVTVQITELDVRMPTPASTANLQQQAKDYQSVIQACLGVFRCNDITTWGVYDGASWVPGTFPGQGAALLFDTNFNKKPAYFAALQAFGCRLR